MTRNQEIIKRFIDGESVFLLSRRWPDLAQPDIESILRQKLKRFGKQSHGGKKR